MGVPIILDTLRETAVPGTFFAPGCTAEKHTSRVELIVSEGHEIGHNSYSHLWAGDSFDQEIEEMEKGLEALKRTVGMVPKGYRSPAGGVGEGLFGLLNKHGFLYDSSLRDHINPYRHVMPDGSKGPIELPRHWSLDDAPFALFSIKNPQPIFTNEQIATVFQDEFREIYRLWRVVRSNNASTGNWAPEPDRPAARHDCIHAHLSVSLVRHRHAGHRGLVRVPRAGVSLAAGTARHVTLRDRVSVDVGPPAYVA